MPARPSIPVERIGLLDTRDDDGHGTATVATGWEAVDAQLGGGLCRGVIHEWLGVAEPGDADNGPVNSRRCWSPPIGLMVHLAWHALQAAGETQAPGHVLWIGERVHPCPTALVDRHAADTRLLLRRSIFVNPGPGAGLFWAVDMAVRCPGVTAVIADGSGMSMAESRRLQLAAARGKALALVVRPPWERRELSVAATRWGVQRAVSALHVDRCGPRWKIHLQRCKGRQRARDPDTDAMTRLSSASLSTSSSTSSSMWLLERDCDAGAVRLSAGVGNGSGSATMPRVG